MTGLVANKMSVIAIATRRVNRVNCKCRLQTKFADNVNIVAGPSTDKEKDGQKVRHFIGTDDRT